MQQYLPLAVLKRDECNIKTTITIKLQQYLPLAVLKQDYNAKNEYIDVKLQQYLPLAVLKLFIIVKSLMIYLLRVATVPTACGIETLSQRSSWFPRICELQQYLPLAVLKLEKLRDIAS